MVEEQQRANASKGEADEELADCHQSIKIPVPVPVGTSPVSSSIQRAATRSQDGSAKARYNRASLIHDTQDEGAHPASPSWALPTTWSTRNCNQAPDTVSSDISLKSGKHANFEEAIPVVDDFSKTMFVQHDDPTEKLSEGKDLVAQRVSGLPELNRKLAPVSKVNQSVVAVPNWGKDDAEKSQPESSRTSCAKPPIGKHPTYKSNGTEAASISAKSSARNETLKCPPLSHSTLRKPGAVAVAPIQSRPAVHLQGTLDAARSTTTSSSISENLETTLEERDSFTKAAFRNRASSVSLEDEVTSQELDERAIALNCLETYCPDLINERSFRAARGSTTKASFRDSRISRFPEAAVQHANSGSEHGNAAFPSPSSVSGSTNINQEILRRPKNVPHYKDQLRSYDSEAGRDVVDSTSALSRGDLSHQGSTETIGSNRNQFHHPISNISACTVETADSTDDGILVNEEYSDPQSAKQESSKNFILQAELVDDDNIREKIIQNAALAEVVDESIVRRRERRRLHITVSLVCVALAAAVVGGSLGLSRKPAELQSNAPSFFPSNVPSMSPSVLPSTMPSLLSRNDFCSDSRVLDTSKIETVADELSSATVDDNAIDCLFQSEIPQRGRWYRYLGNGLDTVIDLCVDSGQVLPPAIFIGQCEDLFCLEIESESINSTDCKFRTRTVIPTAHFTQYWIFIYAQSQLYLDRASYDMMIANNNFCDYATEIKGTGRYSYSLMSAMQQTTSLCGANPSLNPQLPGVWFRWNGRGSFLELDICDGSAPDIVVSVYEGNCSNLRCISNLQTEDCTLSWLAAEDTVYWILVSGTSSETEVNQFQFIATESALASRCEGATVIDTSIARNHTFPIDNQGPLRTRNIDTSCLPTNGNQGELWGVWYTAKGNGTRINMHSCHSDSRISARFLVVDGHCGNATCNSQKLTKNYGCSDPTQRGVTIFAEADVDYFIFIYDIPQSSIYSTSYSDFYPSSTNVRISVEPLAESDAPSMSPTSETLSPTSAECTLDLALACFVHANQEPCYSIDRENKQDITQFDDDFFNDDSESARNLEHIQVDIILAVSALASKRTVQSTIRLVDSDFLLLSPENDASIQLGSDEATFDAQLGLREIKFKATLDFNRRRTYNIRVVVEAIALDGLDCDTITSASFDAGLNAPTLSPSTTMAPTSLSQLQSPCSLQAEIDCQQCISYYQYCTPCQRIRVPQLKCTRFGLASLNFIYTGLPCGSVDDNGRRFRCFDHTQASIQDLSQVWIRIDNGESAEPYFNAVVARDDHIVVELYGLYTEFIRIEIFDQRFGPDNANATLLQTVEMGLRCSFDNVSLFHHYGSLQLIGYDDELVYVDYTLSFRVRNSGAGPLRVTSANTESTLWGIPESSDAMSNLTNSGIVGIHDDAFTVDETFTINAFDVNSTETHSVVFSIIGENPYYSGPACSSDTIYYLPGPDSSSFYPATPAPSAYSTTSEPTVDATGAGTGIDTTAPSVPAATNKPEPSLESSMVSSPTLYPTEGLTVAPSPATTAPLTKSVSPNTAVSSAEAEASRFPTTEPLSTEEPSMGPLTLSSLHPTLSIVPSPIVTTTLLPTDRSLSPSMATTTTTTTLPSINRSLPPSTATPAADGSATSAVSVEEAEEEEEEDTVVSRSPTWTPEPLAFDLVFAPMIEQPTDGPDPGPS